MQVKNFAGALAVALGLTLVLTTPTIAHIATWKVVLGIAGLALFLTAGMGGSQA